MRIVDEPMETIHLYVVREEAKQPFVVLPILAALLCISAIIAVTYYSALHPTYEHKTLTVPAQLLPMKTFTASEPITPTGLKTYPATYAQGVLTFTNGSIIGQSIPAGFTIDDVATDTAVYVPGATADGFGISTVPAHLLTAGINKSTLSINEVIGTSLFIRNLSPFTGGHPAYSVHFITSQDKVSAASKARSIVALQVSGLHYPCTENLFSTATKVVVAWHCQFVKYTVPSSMHVLRIRLISRNLLVDVAFTPPPVGVWVK